MGKKGKKAAKEQQARRERAAAARDLEARVAAARRERAAKIHDLEARVAALVEKLDAELEGVDVFCPLEERDDCPVCMVPLPLSYNEVTHMPCCGKIVCNACSDIQSFHKVMEFIEKTLTTNCDHPAFKTETAFAVAAQKILDNSLCAFCRSPKRSSNMETRQNFAVKMGDSRGMMLVGAAYENGKNDVTKDELAALGWYVRAAEQGHPMALCKVADMCLKGTVVEKNVNYAEQLATAAAKKGCAKAHSLLASIYMRGFMADPLGTTQATRSKMFDHWKFAAAAGCRDSMERLEDFMEKLEDCRKDNLRIMEIKRQDGALVEKLEELEKSEELGTAAIIAKMKKDLDDARDGLAFLEKFEELGALGRIITKEIVDVVKKEHDKAVGTLGLEYSDEREECRKSNGDSLDRIITMLQTKLQEKLGEQANER